jgi:Zn-finger nucleic acid-binding protein
MRTVDRQGVHIDQCESCRGIFLDRGELELIAGAEQRHYSSSPPPYQPERSANYQGERHGKRKRRNFLEELFD